MEKKPDKHSLRLIPRDLSESLGKPPAQAVDLEESTLGAIILESKAIDRVKDFLLPDYFYKEAHKEIYQAILEVAKAKVPISMRSVIHQLRHVGKIELIGGAYYITELTSKVSSSESLEHDARVIVETHIKRQLTLIGSELHQHGFDYSSDALEALDNSVKKLQNLLLEVTQSSGPAKIKSLWESTLILEEPVEEPPLITIDGTPIVIPGNHSLVVGKKKSRKTLFIAYLIAEYLKQNPNSASKVLLFDTEQGKTHVYKLRHKIFLLSGFWVPIFYLRGQSPRDRMDFISQTIKYWEHRPRLVVIDGIRDCLSNINDPDECTEVIVWLEKITLEHNVGIVNILHLNKTDNNARGHIGSELLNKALCTIEMELDPKNGCTLVKCESSRDKSFDTFAFTHDEKGLPMVIGTPIVGTIVPQDEKRKRLEMIFEDGPLKYKDLIEEIRNHFGIGVNRSKSLIAEFQRNGYIVKSGGARSPDTVYKLMISSNGHYAEPKAVQTELNLEKKVEEEVINDLPF